jgi:hypothetical protein
MGWCARTSIYPIMFANLHTRSSGSQSCARVLQRPGWHGERNPGFYRPPPYFIETLTQAYELLFPFALAFSIPDTALSSSALQNNPITMISQNHFETLTDLIEQE